MQAKHQLLFVQGGGQGTHDLWDDKLVDSLQRHLGRDYEIRYPRMPGEDDPSYLAWKSALERELQTLQDGAVLVGHSIGATILLKVLADRPPTRKLGAIITLAAPFVGDGGWSSDDFQFAHDLGALLPRGVPVHLYHGLDDETAPPAHADLYARAIPQARVHRLTSRDHQLNDDLSDVASVISSLVAGP